MRKITVVLENKKGQVFEEFGMLHPDGRIKLFLGKPDGRDAFQKIKTTGKGEYLLSYGERVYLKSYY